MHRPMRRTTCFWEEMYSLLDDSAIDTIQVTDVDEDKPAVAVMATSMAAALYGGHNVAY